MIDAAVITNGAEEIVERRARILIADDEPHVLRVLKMSLEKEGYAVNNSGITYA